MTGNTCPCRPERNISIHMPHTWHDAHDWAEWEPDEISIHMPHTWHDLSRLEIVPLVLISIHMPHTWHDSSLSHSRNQLFHFNPHATYVA